MVGPTRDNIHATVGSITWNPNRPPMFERNALSERKISGVDKTKRKQYALQPRGRLSRPAYNQSQLKQEHGWMCSPTDIACWKFVYNDLYSTRSVHTHEADGNETMVNIYFWERCDVLQCWHEKEHRIAWLHILTSWAIEWRSLVLWA